MFQTFFCWHRLNRLFLRNLMTSVIKLHEWRWNPLGNRAILIFSKNLYQNILSHGYCILCLHFSRAIIIIFCFGWIWNTKDNFLQEPEKMNDKVHRKWENTGKIVMSKFSFCENWDFWGLFSWAQVRSSYLELFHTTYYIYSP